jgi:hypothetical protein
MRAASLVDRCRVTHMHLGRKQAPNPVILLGTERGNLVSLPLGGQHAARRRLWRCELGMLEEANAAL